MKCDVGFNWKDFFASFDFHYSVDDWMNYYYCYSKLEIWYFVVDEMVKNYGDDCCYCNDEFDGWMELSSSSWMMMNWMNYCY